MRKYTVTGIAAVLTVAIGVTGFDARSIADSGRGAENGGGAMGPGMMAQGMMGQGMMGPGMTGPGMMGQRMGYGGHMMGPGMGYGMMGQGMGYGGHMMGPGMGYGMMGPGMGYGGHMMGPGMGYGMMGPGMGYRMMGPGMMGPGMMGPGARVYPMNLGEDDVKAYFTRMLAIWGNKRLKLGKVAKKDEHTIVADIVTVDGSLVERYAVDRRTGFMRPEE